MLTVSLILLSILKWDKAQKAKDQDKVLPRFSIKILSR